jgi:hypothetical protein
LSQSTGPRIAEFLEMSYFCRALRRIMTVTGLLPRPVTEVRVDALRPRVGEDAHGRNLSHIAETKRLAIPLLFLLLSGSKMSTPQ